MNREEVLDLLYFIIELAGRNKGESQVAIHEEKSIFLEGDSSLIELVDYSNQGDILYTTDGGDPSTEGKPYTVPFYAKNTTLIKAISTHEEVKSEEANRTVHQVDTALNGLNWQLYRSIEDGIVDVSNKVPDATGIAYTISTDNIAEGENNFMIHFDGYLQIDKAGAYTFYTLQDDLVQLFIGNQLVVESQDGWFDGEKEGSIYLEAGKHPIKVKFFDHLASEYLTVHYSTDGVEKQMLNGDMLFRE